MRLGNETAFNFSYKSVPAKGVRTAKFRKLKFQSPAIFFILFKILFIKIRSDNI